MKIYSPVTPVTLFMPLLLACYMVACQTQATPPDVALSAHHRVVPTRPRPAMAPIVPQVPDPRTAIQIASAACGVRCTIPGAPKLLSASTSQPIIPASWTVPAWFIDPAKTVPCAGDNLSGTSATCVGGCSGSTCPSGIGPLVSYQELNTHRWGCSRGLRNCPFVRQDTVVDWLSSTTNAADVAYASPGIENGSYFNLKGEPTTVCGGTLAGVVPKSRTPAPGQKLEADLCVGAADDLFVLNTDKNSGAWIFANVAGALWSLSQPLATFTIPWNGVDPNEDDSWANGDHYVVESFPAVFLASLSQITTDDPGGFVLQQAYTQHIEIAPSAANGNFTLEGTIFPTETAIDRYFSTGVGSFSQGLNSDAEHAIIFQTVTPDTLSSGGWKAGIIRQDLETGVSMFLEGGVIVSAPSGLIDYSGQLNDVEIETGSFLSCAGHCDGFGTLGQAVPTIWGGGQFDVQTPGQFFINANTAAPTLLVSNITIDGLPTACSQSATAPAVINCNITITGAAIDAPFGVAGFGGVALNPTGGSINTLSSPF